MAVWTKDKTGKYRNLDHARNMYRKDKSVIVEFVQQRIDLGPYESEEEAQAALESWIALLNQPPPVTAILDPNTTLVMVGDVMNRLAEINGKKGKKVKVKK